MGWDGAYLVGRWTPIEVEFDATERDVQSGCRLQVTTPDPDGHRVTISRELVKPTTTGRQRLRGHFKPGRLDPHIELRVDGGMSDADDRIWRASPGEGSRLPKPLAPGTQLVVTVGEPKGFVSTDALISQSDAEVIQSPRHVVAVTVDQLPTEPLSYDAVSLLVIAGPTIVSAEQSQALRDWVARGGRLAISLPSDLAVARQVVQPLADWLPATLAAEPVVVREFPKLESYAGQNVRVPFRDRLSIPGVRIEHGAILAGSRDDALLVRIPYGLGSVTILALDLTKPPLRDWAGVDALGRRLVNDVTSSEHPGEGRNSKRAQLSSTGVTDLATQLHSIQDDFGGVTRSSPWLVMGLLGLLALAVGPLDYLLVHHLLKRPRATWITLPVWIGLAVGLAVSTGAAWNGTALRINQFQLLNVDAATNACRARLWTDVYSPETTRLTRLQATSLPSTPAQETASLRQQRTIWSGIPETVFGGMYRPAGLEIGRSEYRVGEQNAQIDELPLAQWSSKSLVTETTGATSGLIDSDLKAAGSGRLTGTLTHRLNGAIEDWFLVYGNRVYRQLKQRDDVRSLPLPSRQLWRVEQPNVFQRELRPFLTGEITIATTKKGGDVQRVEQRQAEYDSLSLDPLAFARLLTFHDEAGGTKYTGLTNRVLADEDLSHLLKLGRAILFGRLVGPASSTAIDGNSIKPDRELTFVRLVLPVKKTEEALPRQLESFDPNK